MNIEEQIINLRETNMGQAIFKISSSEGENDSEKESIKLIKKSCLSLWTIPNPYIDKGQEIIDILIIFGNDILLISDKNRDKPSVSPDLEIWKGIKKHITKSSNQLKFAKNELEKNPPKIYIDSLATESIDLILPPKNLRKYHFITILRGYENGAKSYLKNVEGNFLINTENNKSPYILPDQKRSQFFMHIFDSVGLEKLIKELTTVKDIIDYLNKRENFFTKYEKIIAPSEDALIASYFTSLENENSEEPFLKLSLEKESKVIFPANLYNNYTSTQKYKSTHVSIQASLYIDLMIEKLIYMGNPKEIEPEASINNTNVANTIEYLAKLKRDDRVYLFKCINKLHSNLPKDKEIKICYNNTAIPSLPNYLIIYCLLKKNKEQTNEQYREERSNAANYLVKEMQNKKQNQDKNIFLVIVRDMPNHIDNLTSIDLYVFNS